MASIALIKEKLFIDAATDGYVLYVLHNILQKKLNINATDEHSQTALQMASFNGHIRILFFIC